MPARVIPPVTITDALLISSSAPEPGVGEAAFNIATTYAKGANATLAAPSATVTITIASPGVITWANHGIPEGTTVVLDTTGALPTGFEPDTPYYVVNATAGAFELSTDVDGLPIVTSGTQSGTHTATAWLHRNYESLVDGNVGNPPAISPDQWFDAGPTNRWGMFDTLRNTRTWGVPGEDLVVTITPGQRINSMALLGVIADEVDIDVEVDSVSLYSHSISLRDRNVLKWWDYFFTPFMLRPSLARFDLPPYANAEITVTLRRASGPPGLGALVIGTYVELGQVEIDAESDALNFSTVDRDAFGNAILIPRRTVPGANMTIMFDKTAVNAIRDVRTQLNAVPAVWAGLSDDTDEWFDALLILGFYRQFKINMTYPDKGIITLELEEV